MERILQMKEQVEASGLKVLGIESVNIHDAIKVGTPDREQYIANYITTLERLGQAGIQVVCYNFMPVSYTHLEMEYEACIRGGCGHLRTGHHNSGCSGKGCLYKRRRQPSG